MITILIGFAIAYLMGSIPSGVWVSVYLYDKDVRRYGSGNSGTTNVFRVLGTKAGILVFVLDVLKGLLPTLLMGIVFGQTIHPILFGVFAIIGHTNSVFARFRGGKAVATTCGVGLAIYPTFVVAMLLIFALILYLSSMVSLASLVAIGSAFLFSFLLGDWLFTGVLGLIFLLVIYRHWENIVRIKEGRENRVPFGLNSSKKDK